LTVAQFTSPTFRYETAKMASFIPVDQRPLKDTICLFDVDGTLTPARLVCSLFPSSPFPAKSPSMPECWCLVLGGEAALDPTIAKDRRLPRHRRRFSAPKRASSTQHAKKKDCRNDN